MGRNARHNAELGARARVARRDAPSLRHPKRADPLLAELHARLGNDRLLSLMRHGPDGDDELYALHLIQLAQRTGLDFGPLLPWRAPPSFARWVRPWYRVLWAEQARQQARTDAALVGQDADRPYLEAVPDMERDDWLHEWFAAAVPQGGLPRAEPVDLRAWGFRPPHGVGPAGHHLVEHLAQGLPSQPPSAPREVVEAVLQELLGGHAAATARELDLDLDLDQLPTRALALLAGHTPRADELDGAERWFAPYPDLGQRVASLADGTARELHAIQARPQLHHYGALLQEVPTVEPSEHIAPDHTAVADPVLAAALSTDAATDPWDSEQVLALLRHSRATPLPPALAEQASGAMDHDLRGVRIHVDAAAARAAELLGAVAFTVGRDIYFGLDAWRPDSAEGRRVLAHELQHVVQHDEGRLPDGPGTGEVEVSDPASSIEQEAEQAERFAVELDPITPVLPGEGELAWSDAEVDLREAFAPREEKKEEGDDKEDEEESTTESTPPPAPTSVVVTIGGIGVTVPLPKGLTRKSYTATLNSQPLPGLTVDKVKLKFDDTWEITGGSVDATFGLQVKRVHFTSPVSLKMERGGTVSGTVKGQALSAGGGVSGTVDATFDKSGVKVDGGVKFVSDFPLVVDPSGKLDAKKDTSVDVEADSTGLKKLSSDDLVLVYTQASDAGSSAGMLEAEGSGSYADGVLKGGGKAKITSPLMFASAPWKTKVSQGEGGEGTATVEDSKLAKLDLKQVSGEVFKDEVLFATGTLETLAWNESDGPTAKGKLQLEQPITFEALNMKQELTTRPADPATLGVTKGALDQAKGNFRLAFTNDKGELASGDFEGDWTEAEGLKQGKGELKTTQNVPIGDPNGVNAVLREGLDLKVASEPEAGLSVTLNGLDLCIFAGSRPVFNLVSEEASYDGEGFDGSFQMELDPNLSFQIGPLKVTLATKEKGGTIKAGVGENGPYFQGTGLEAKLDWLTGDKESGSASQDGGGAFGKLSWPDWTFDLRGLVGDPTHAFSLPEGLDFSKLIAWLKGLMGGGGGGGQDAAAGGGEGFGWPDWLLQLVGKLAGLLQGTGEGGGGGGGGGLQGPDFSGIIDGVISWISGFEFQFPNPISLGEPPALDFGAFLSQAWTKLKALVEGVSIGPFDLPSLGSLFEGISLEGFGWTKDKSLDEGGGGGGGLKLGFTGDGNFDVALNGMDLPSMTATEVWAAVTYDGAELARLHAPKMSFDGPTQTFAAESELTVSEQNGVKVGSGELALKSEKPVAVSFQKAPGKPWSMGLGEVTALFEQDDETKATGTFTGSLASGKKPLGTATLTLDKALKLGGDNLWTEIGGQDGKPVTFTLKSTEDAMAGSFDSLEATIKTPQRALGGLKGTNVGYDGDKLLAEGMEAWLDPNLQVKVGPLTITVRNGSGGEPTPLTAGFRGNSGLQLSGTDTLEVDLDRDQAGGGREPDEARGGLAWLKWPKGWTIDVTGIGGPAFEWDLRWPSAGFSSIWNWLKGLFTGKGPAEGEPKADSGGGSGFADWLLKLLGRLETISIEGVDLSGLWQEALDALKKLKPSINWNKKLPLFDPADWPLTRFVSEGFKALLAQIGKLTLPKLTWATITKLFEGLNIPGLEWLSKKSLDEGEGASGSGIALTLETRGTLDVELQGGSIPHVNGEKLGATLLYKNEKVAAIDTETVTWDGTNLKVTGLQAAVLETFELPMGKGYALSFHGGQKASFEKNGQAPYKLGLEGLGAKLKKGSDVVGEGKLSAVFQSGEAIQGSGSITVDEDLKLGSEKLFLTIAKGFVLGIDAKKASQDGGGGGITWKLDGLKTELKTPERTVAELQVGQASFDGEQVNGDFSGTLDPNLEVKIGSVTATIAAEGKVGLSYIDGELAAQGTKLSIDVDKEGGGEQSGEGGGFSLGSLKWPKWSLSLKGLFGKLDWEMPLPKKMDLSSILAWIKGLLAGGGKQEAPKPVDNESGAGFGMPDWLLKLMARVSKLVKGVGQALKGFVDQLKGMTFAWPDPLPVWGGIDLSFLVGFGREVLQKLMAALGQLKIGPIPFGDIPKIFEGLTIPGFDWKKWFGGKEKGAKQAEGGGEGLQLGVDGEGTFHIVMNEGDLPTITGQGLKGSLLYKQKKVVTLSASTFTLDGPGKTVAATWALAAKEGYDLDLGPHQLSLSGGSNVQFQAGVDAPWAFTVPKLTGTLKEGKKEVATGSVHSVKLDAGGFTGRADGTVTDTFYLTNKDAEWFLRTKKKTGFSVDVTQNQLKAATVTGEIALLKGAKEMATATAKQLGYTAQEKITGSAVAVVKGPSLALTDALTLKKGAKAEVFTKNGSFDRMELSGKFVYKTKTDDGQDLQVNGAITKGTFSGGQIGFKAEAGLQKELELGSDENKVRVKTPSRTKGFLVDVTDNELQTLKVSKVTFRADLGGKDGLGLDGTITEGSYQKGVGLGLDTDVSVKRGKRWTSPNGFFEIPKNGGSGRVKVVANQLTEVKVQKLKAKAQLDELKLAGEVTSGTWNGTTKKLEKVKARVSLSDDFTLGKGQKASLKLLKNKGFLELGVDQSELTSLAFKNLAFQARAKRASGKPLVADGAIEQGGYDKGKFAFNAHATLAEAATFGKGKLEGELAQQARIAVDVDGTEIKKLDFTNAAFLVKAGKEFGLEGKVRQATYAEGAFQTLDAELGLGSTPAVFKAGKALTATVLSGKAGVSIADGELSQLTMENLVTEVAYESKKKKTRAKVALTTGDFDGKTLTGSGAAELLDEVVLGEQTKVTVKPGAGLTASLEKNKLTAVTGKLNAAVTDKEGKPLLDGWANGTFKAHEGLFGGTGGMKLQRKVKVPADKAWGLELAKDTQMTATVADNAFTSVTGNVDVGILDTAGEKLLTAGLAVTQCDLAGPEPVFSGTATVKDMKGFTLPMPGDNSITIKPKKGGGFSADVQQNRLTTFTATGIDFVLDTYEDSKGKPLQGGVQKLVFTMPATDGPPDVDLEGGSISAFTLWKDQLSLAIDSLDYIGDTFSAAGKGDFTFDDNLTGKLGLALDNDWKTRLSIDTQVIAPLFEAQELFRFGAPAEGGGKKGKPWELVNVDVKLPKGIGTVEMRMSAGFALKAQKTDLTADMKLGEFEFDPDNPKLPDFRADATVSGGFEASAGLEPVIEATIGSKDALAGSLEGKAPFTSSLKVEPNASGHIEAKQGVFGGALDFGLKVTGGGTLAPAISLKGYLLGGELMNEEVWSESYDLADLFAWDYELGVTFGGQGDAAQSAAPTPEGGAKGLVDLSKEAPKAEKSFEDAKQPAAAAPGPDAQQSEPSAMDKMKHIGNLLQIFGGFASVYAGIFAIAKALLPPDPPVIYDYVLGGAGQKLFDDILGFYDSVKKAEDDGTFEWIEREMPEPFVIMTDLLKAYLKAVEELSGPSVDEMIESSDGCRRFVEDLAMHRAGAVEQIYFAKTGKLGGDSYAADIKRWALNSPDSPTWKDVPGVSFHATPHQAMASNPELWEAKLNGLKNEYVGMGGNVMQDKWFPGRWERVPTAGDGVSAAVATALEGVHQKAEQAAGQANAPGGEGTDEGGG